MAQSEEAYRGADFYDDPEVFATYWRARARSNSPNELLEQPVIWELISEQPLRGNRVLDLGCGDGAFGQELLAAGCRSYTGIDGSHQMVARAKAKLTAANTEVLHANIETWDYPQARFDLVISRLVLHYLADLPALLAGVNGTLTPGGRMIFSVEHPVITACNRSRGEDGNGKRQDWIVDDYFVSGARTVRWLDQWVVKYHRTVEDYFLALQRANFTVTHLRESRPDARLFREPLEFQRRSRIPLFLFIAAQRNGS